ncbi:hypothetical protein CONLIGDRAFT_639333 [Coniochaeta ligniaria NRRL 30616]|uniref:Uncharacterized protein n=1 Tax=Coniochaeta ligniaria NRRL 30616 TaxID=1408157 RepID=A0A1J7JZZ1_9PEZI|nr:hypothetical protein CONLIGDRAFT_639333 [Coniochaeta ligniaria NRRL 30616]
MAVPMDVFDAGEIRAFIDPFTERELFNEFIDLDRLVRDYDPSVTDVSMTSESASESPSERTRPTTTENSEVTSNAPSYDLDQDDMMQETGASSRDHPSAGDQQSGLDSSSLLIPVLRDEHKKRTVVDRPPTLPPSGGLVDEVLAPTIHLRASRLIAPRPDAHPITSWRDGSHPRPEVSQERAPRSRTLVDPKKTADVRAKGSCLHCSISKVRCDVADLCARCRTWDPDNHHRVCVRTSIGDILRSGRSSILDGGRWTPERSQLASSLDGRSRLGGPTFITVYFSSSDRQGLTIPVTEHADGHLRILHDCQPTNQVKILKWAENDLGNPVSGNFQSSIEAFLYLYSQRDCVEKVGSIATLTWIVLVVRMSSLWRLISASELCYCYALDGQQCKMPLPSSIATELKHFAQREMSSAEEKAIDEISNLIPIAFSNNNSDAPAIWAALWSVISIYRSALQKVASHVVAFKDDFGEVTRRLLDALIVAFCDHYRTRKVLETLDSAFQPSFLGWDDVRAAYDQARQKRHCFYEEVRAYECHGDELIVAHAVKNEEKPRKKRKQTEFVPLQMRAWGSWEA